MNKRTLFFFLLLLTFALPALATGGADAPWNATLEKVTAWFTGATGKSIILIAGAFALYGLAFGEGGTAMRKLAYFAAAAAVFGVIVNFTDTLMSSGGALL